MQKITSGLIVVLALGVLAAFAFGLGWKLKPTPLPSVLQKIDTMVVTRTQLVESAPKVQLKTVDRIIYREVPPELVMIGTNPDTVPADSQAVTGPDSTRSQNPETILEPPTLPYLAGRFHSGKLELWAERSDGSVLYERRGVHAPFDFVTDSTAMHVHEQRAWLRFVKGAAKCAASAAVGAAGGALVVGKDRTGGAIAGAAAGCAGSVVF